MSAPETTAADGVAALVAEQARRHPDHVWAEAARYDRRVDRRQLAAVVARWGEQGVSGQRIGLAVADPVVFAALFVALIAAGATVVPLDPQAPAYANRALLRAAGAARVVATHADQLPVDADQVEWVDAATLLPGAPRAGTHGTPAEGGCLLFSSGSTGPRKPIRLAEHQLLYVAAAVAEACELTAGDRCYNSLPLCHVNAEVVALLAPLLSGGTVVLDGRFHATGFWPLVIHHGITWINAVPGILAVLAQEPAVPAVPASLRFVRSASAPLSPAVLERFERLAGVPVIESYGMTEAASQITANPLRGRRPGTVGRPRGVQLRVVDDDGSDVGPGEVGRVLIRGAGVIVEYADGAGAERFDPEGWLDTGDLGRLDGDGFLVLAARQGDLINRSGEKVFPREIEDVLRGDPGVGEAVVVGRTDAVLGQLPVAYVVPAAAAPLDLVAQLDRRCAHRLPRAYRPAEVVLVPDLPLGPTGKVVRRLVAEYDARRAVAASGELVSRHAG